MRVSDLFIYPLKSARGIALPFTEIDAHGLPGDRRAMVTDAKGWVSNSSVHAVYVDGPVAVSLTPGKGAVSSSATSLSLTANVAGGRSRTRGCRA